MEEIKEVVETEVKAEEKAETKVVTVTMPNDRSVGLHKKFGFEELGRFPRSGYKHGKWHDVIWMGRPLAELNDADGDPAEPNLLV